LKEWTSLREFTIAFSNVPLDPIEFWSHRDMLQSLTALSLSIKRSVELLRFPSANTFKPGSLVSVGSGKAEILDLDVLFPNLRKLTLPAYDHELPNVKWPSQLEELEISTPKCPLVLPPTLTALSAPVKSVDWKSHIPNLTKLHLRHTEYETAPIYFPPSVTDVSNTLMSWSQLKKIDDTSRLTGFMLHDWREEVSGSIPPSVVYLYAKGNLMPEMVANASGITSLTFEGPGRGDLLVETLSKSLRTLSLARCNMPSVLPPQIVELDIDSITKTSALASLLQALPRKGLQILRCPWLDSVEASALPSSLHTLSFSDRANTVHSHQSTIPNLGHLPRNITSLKLEMEKTRRLQRGFDHTFFQKMPNQLLHLDISMPCSKLSFDKLLQEMPQGLESLDFSLFPIKHNRTHPYHGLFDLNALPRDITTLRLDIPGVNFESFEIRWPKSIRDIHLLQVTKDILHQLPASLDHLTVTLPRLGYIGSIRAPKLASLRVICPKQPDALEPHMLTNLPPTLMFFSISGSRQKRDVDPKILKAAFDLRY
jgi:hypothetical protein